MNTTDIESEIPRLLGMVNAIGWKRAWVEVSCIGGPFPWRVIFGGFSRVPTMIQGIGIEDAFAKSRRWIEAGAITGTRLTSAE